MVENFVTGTDASLAMYLKLFNWISDASSIWPMPEDRNQAPWYIDITPCCCSPLLPKDCHPEPIATYAVDVQKRKATTVSSKDEAATATNVIEFLRGGYGKRQSSLRVQRNRIIPSLFLPSAAEIERILPPVEHSLDTAYSIEAANGANTMLAKTQRRLHQPLIYVFILCMPFSNLIIFCLCESLPD